MYAAAVPAAASVVLAAAAGSALARAFARRIEPHEPMTIDWGPILLLSTLMLALIALAISTTLPAIRSATRPEGIRTD